MKLFTVGPVNMYPEVRSIHINDMVYFRTDEFSNIVKNNIYRLSYLLDSDYIPGIFYITASGTAAMESVITNCITKNDRALVINGGTFGHRFCTLLQYYHIKFDSINISWNEHLTEQHFKNINGKNYSVFLVNLHETSTGQLYDIDLIKTFCKENNIMLIVDAISTFLADDFSMRKNDIDITIISSQKGLCLSPGLSFIAMSKRMHDRYKTIKPYGSKYLYFNDYLTNIERGQTPYQPVEKVRNL